MNLLLALLLQVTTTTTVVGVPNGQVASMRVVSVNIPAAAVLTLDTTPVVLLPAKAGAAYLPWALSVYKPAGTAYANIAAGDDLQLESTSAVAYNTIETTGFLDQASAQGAANRFGAGSLTTALLDVGIRIKLLGPIDTGNSPLIVKLMYWEIDASTLP